MNFFRVIFFLILLWVFKKIYKYLKWFCIVNIFLYNFCFDYYIFLFIRLRNILSIDRELGICIKYVLGVKDIVTKWKDKDYIFNECFWEKEGGNK